MAKGRGPLAAMRHMKRVFDSRDKKDEWFKEANGNAILGSCSRTLPSVRNGLSCYMSFAGWLDSVID